MADFVNVPINVDPAVMADGAIEGLRGTWEGWEPDDGDIEVVVVEEVSPIAAQVAAIAAVVPAETFRTIGTKVFQVPYETGSPALTTVTLTFLDGAGYHLDAGLQLAIDGYAFSLVSDVNCPVDQTEVAGVPVQCVLAGAEVNGLTGAIVDSLTIPQFVIGISVDAATSEGVDDENDDEYLARVSREMVLRAKTLVTARDFAIQAMENDRVARAYVEENTVRQMNVTLVGLDGAATSSEVKSEVQADYESFGMVNLTWNIGDAHYNIVDVAVTVLADPVATAADVQSRTSSALQTLLTPLQWGRPAETRTSLSVPGWKNTPTIMRNALIAMLGNQSGVIEIVDLTLSSPTAGAVVESNGDLAMAGAVPLPQIGTITVTVEYPPA